MRLGLAFPFLAALARRVRRLSHSGEVWVIFDNTATRATVDNARSLMSLLARRRQPSARPRG